MEDRPFAWIRFISLSSQATNVRPSKVQYSPSDLPVGPRGEQNSACPRTERPHPTHKTRPGATAAEAKAAAAVEAQRAERQRRPPSKGRERFADDAWPRGTSPRTQRRTTMTTATVASAIAIVGCLLLLQQPLATRAADAGDAKRTRVMPSGEPCAFPMEYNGELVDDCVDFQSGGKWCRGHGGEWGPCVAYEPVAPDPDARVIPPLLPSASFSNPEDNGEAQVSDLTALYYGECCRRLAVMGFQSNAPVIIVDSNGKEIPDEPKIDGHMCTCGYPGGEYDGPIGVEIRGSTSARDYDKKSFAIETRNANGTAEDVALFGFPKDNDWVLYGPEADRTMGMRNLIAYTLARSAGRYASRIRYCELFLVQDGKNLSANHYHGVYLLAEKVKRGSSRVNIARREGNDLSGGYIFKYDNDNDDPGDKLFSTSISTLQMIMVYPRANDVNKKEIEWVKGYVDDFEAALASEDFKHPKKGYQPFIDIGSFVDYFLVSEITKNPDSYRGSTFVHKDRNGPLAMGPVWDYNEAFGLCCGFPIEGFQNNGQSTGRSGGSAISPEGWRFNICIDPWRCQVDQLDGISLWYRRLWQDPDFKKAVRARWTRLRAGAFSDERVEEIFAEVQEGIKNIVLRNYRRWKTTLKGGNDVQNLKTWDFEVVTLKNWLLSHLAWMDSQLIREPLSSSKSIAEKSG